MRALSVSWGADTGGLAIALVRAFADDPEWEFRSMVRRSNYIEYPPDLAWDAQEAVRRWAEADVVQLHNNFAAVDMLDPPSKPMVLYHHGTIFRSDPDRWLDESHRRGAVGVCSTVDLCRYAPDELTWLPAAVNVDHMQRIRQEYHRSDGIIRIAHAPTDRLIKSTDAFREAIAELQAEGLPVEPVIITREPWYRCLALKAVADIYFDQVMLGYGVNAIEAWAMGMPVVAGAWDETLDDMEQRWGSLPFVHATVDTIADALRELVVDEQRRAHWAERGMRHVQEWHAEASVVEQVKAVYRRAYAAHDRAA